MPRFGHHTLSMSDSTSEAENTAALTPYRSPYWLPGGHAQTIHAATWVHRPQVAYSRERWETPDFDFIDLDWVDNANQ